MIEKSAHPAAELLLLGGFLLRGPGREAVPVSSRKSRAMIAVLALSPGLTATRSALAGLLWGERAERQARGSLRQAIVVLRKELGSAFAGFLKIGIDTIGLDEAAVRIDVVDLLRLGRSARVGDLENAASLYRGEFLAGLDLQEPGFDEWLTRKRAEMHEAAIQTLDRWQDALAGRERVLALHRLLGLDPLREGTHVALMHAYVDEGNVGLAMRQFEDCRRLLQDELGVEPALETKRLRDAIAAGKRSAVLPPPPAAFAGPSIAVLPLTNRGGDPADDYFGEGLADDIATELTRYRSLSVTGTVSAFSVQALVADPRVASRRLGVSYLVTGGFRRVDDALLINIQLLASVDGMVVWADRFSGPIGELQGFQSEAVQTIVSRIEGSLIARERSLLARLPERNWRAYDFVLRGRYALNHYRVADAEQYFKQALVVDPQTSDAHAYLAMGYVAQNWISGAALDLIQARSHAEAAVECDRNNPVAHTALAYVFHYGGALEAAGPHYQRALALNPNDPKLLAYIGAWHTYMGELETALEFSDRALARDIYPSPAVWSLRSNTLYQLGRYTETIACIDQIAKPSAWDMPYLVAALAQAGSNGIDRLRSSYENLLTQEFDVLQRHASQEPYRLSAHRQRLIAGVRLARLSGLTKITD